MYDDLNKIPDRTLEAFARGFFNEASLYGFKQTDYIRFVNHLLDITITMRNSKDKFHSSIEAPFARDYGLESPGNSYSYKLPICGKTVSIRAFDIEYDLAIMRHWIEGNSGHHFLLSYTDPIITEIDEFLCDNQNHFGIITVNSGLPIGAIAYLNHDKTQCKAELRKLIGDPGMRGKGFGKKASLLWLSYGVKALGLKKIILSTLDTNTRNIRLNESLGFKVEGILRNEVLIDGHYRDVLRMGLWID
jgi:RimJ/RimL family protein N-acetyltransferase